MEIAIIALQQTLVMFLLIAIGYTLYKTKKITKEGSRDMAATLLHIILPCVIVKSFCTEYSVEKSNHLLISFVLSVVCLGISMLISRLFFKKRSIDQFGAAFSNAGFMGIPLIQAILGETAVIFAAPFIAVLNILQWTYGVFVLTGKKEAVSLKKILTNPVLISLVIGIICFYSQVTLPKIVSTTITYVAGMNAPIAMIVLGVYLAQANIKELFTESVLYINAAVRLIVIPLVTIAILTFLPANLKMAKFALLIVASAPVGSNVAVYAQLNGMDYTYASKTVCMSTLLSIATMPLIMFVAQSIWG